MFLHQSHWFASVINSFLLPLLKCHAAARPPSGANWNTRPKRCFRNDFSNDIWRESVRFVSLSNDRHVPLYQSSRILIGWDFITLTARLKMWWLIWGQALERQNLKVHPMSIVRVIGGANTHSVCFMGEIHSKVHLRRMLDFEGRCSTLLGIKLPLCLWAQMFPCGTSIRAHRGGGRGESFEPNCWLPSCDQLPECAATDCPVQPVFVSLCTDVNVARVKPDKGRLLQMFGLLHSVC